MACLKCILNIKLNVLIKVYIVKYGLVGVIKRSFYYDDSENPPRSFSASDWLAVIAGPRAKCGLVGGPLRFSVACSACY